MQLNNPNFPSYQEEVGDTSLIISAIYELKRTIERISIPEPPEAAESIEVNNFDVVKLYLREELSKALGPIIKKIGDIKFPEPKDFPNEMKVSNFPEVKYPEKMEVSNLYELGEYFKNLSEVIKQSLIINIPESVVNVAPPNVMVDSPIVNVEKPDLSPLLKALDPLKFISDRPDKPISVRMSDGHKFIKAVQQIIQGQDKLAFAVSNSSGLDQGEFKSTIRNVDDVLGQYRINDTDDDASPNYYGFQDAMGDWYILKETISSGANTYRYVKGSSDYSTNWTNRAALTYGLFDSVF